MWTQWIHYTNLKRCLKWNEVAWRDDMYFCWWVRKDYVIKEFERPKKEDYVKKTYFYIDIDIRKTYKEINWILLVWEDFRKECDRVTELIMWISKPNAIVYSWNWIHAYYIGKEKNISEDRYSIWVWYFLKKLNEKLWIYKADPVSKSKAAVSRLPWTYNKFSSETKYWIEKQDVELIWYLWWNSEDWENIWDYYEKWLAEITYKPKEFEVSNTWWDNIFEAINNINVWELFSKNTWLEIARDWKNFISQKDWWYIWAFYSQELNIIITTWTHYLSSWDTWYCTWSYVKNEVLWTENNKDVIEWFKSNFPHIKQISDNERLLYLEWKKNIWEKEIVIKKEEKSSRDPSNYTWTYYSRWNKVLDAMIWFNEDHDLIVIHWKYNSWKTTFSTNMANTAWEKGIKSVLFTLEMNKEKLKKAQAIWRVWLTKPEIQEKRYTDEQLQKMKDIYNNYDKNFLLVWEWQSVDISDLCNNIRKLYEEWYKLFIIDNLRKINVPWAKTDNQVDIAKMQALQSLKNELPICIVLIHHDNKWWTWFSWTQVIWDLADTIVHVTKKLDPDADWKVIFHQSIIDIYKERLNMIREFTFEFDKWILRYVNSLIKWEEK